MKGIIIFSILLIVISCSSKRIDYNSQKRVALVIGNQNYSDGSLKNPIEDAKGIVDTLKTIGFKPENIFFKTDVNYKEFYNLLEEFKNRIDNNTIAFFYFSGHANTLQRNSTNSFLAMVDKRENVIVSIHKIYEVLSEAKARHNIICIDACRDFNQTSRDKKGVLYRDMDWSEEKALPLVVKDNKHYSSPVSTIVSFAANVNEGARDEGIIDKTHSPYARYLIEHLNDVDIPVGEIFNRIRVDMRAELDGKQRNIESGALEGNPWLNPKKGDVPTTVAF